MLYGRSLIEDQRYFIEHEFLPAVEREKPNFVLISGDIYDRQIAPTEAIALFDFTLNSLAEMKVPTFIISGNHDGADRMAIMKDLLRRQGMYISTNLDDAKIVPEIEINGEKAQIFLLPFIDAATARDYFADETLRGAGAAVQAAIEQIFKPQFKAGYKKIILSHCFAAGSVKSDSESTIFVGGSGEVPPAVFADFDYTALGHLHGAQKAGQSGRYSGSPLKYSVDEQNHKKCFLEVELTDESLSIKEIPVTPVHDVRRITGLFDDIFAQGQEKKCEDYVEIILEDKRPIMMAAEKLRPLYPNMLAVHNRWMASASENQRSKDLKNQNESEIFMAFVEEVCGEKASNSETELFLSVLAKIKESEGLI